MNNPFGLEGKKIAVTGSTAGIGRAIAQSAAHLGAELIINGRNAEKAKITLESLINGPHEILLADLTVKNQRDEFVRQTPVLDGLVLNAGKLITKPFKFLTDETLAEVMDTNFSAGVLLLKDLIKNKKLNKNASVVFISSIGGNLIGHVGNAAYSASKGAINGIVKVLALELAPRGIRVNSVMPGMVKTELWENGDYSAEQIAEDEKKYPLGYGTPEDVAHAVVYLLSPAAKWVTGSHLLIDGGYTAN